MTLLRTWARRTALLLGPVGFVLLEAAPKIRY